MKRGKMAKFDCLDYFQPPIIPQVKNDGDTSNFDEYPEEDDRIANATLEPGDL